MDRAQLPFRSNTEGYLLDSVGNVLAQVQDGILVFPGGGVEKDEAILDVITRETFEETGVVIEHVRLLGTIRFVWSESWARTEKQKLRFEQFEGEEMHFFTGRIKEFREPIGEDKWIGELLMPVSKAIEFLESQKPFKSEALYREKQLGFLKTILGRFH
ncbi:NUDIX domain-containing protein [Candidatus Woesearchaeota archaeon]|nr:NUDIX domain-containing protein [Candidatus Woesearchaeota archaeon]